MHLRSDLLHACRHEGSQVAGPVRVEGGQPEPLLGYGGCLVVFPFDIALLMRSMECK
jgi:hypothetical protein